MFDRAVEAAIIILGAAFEERAPAALIRWLPGLAAYEIWVKLAYWSGLVILFFLVTGFFRGGWRDVGFLRRRLLECARFEGVWLQRVTNERPNSLCAIEYVPAEGKWRYRGIGFDAQFQLRAEWETHSIFYDTRRRAWHFAGNGKLIDESTGVPREVNAFDIAVVLILGREPRLGFHAKAADFNFSQPTQGAQERVFSIVSHLSHHPIVVVEDARNMTPTRRAALFKP